MKDNGNRSGLLQLIDKKKFDDLVLKWAMDKWIRSLNTWEFTCALVTVMTTRLGSYREVEYTLGISRSTFGDAMALRSHGFFEELCDLILFQIRARTIDRKIRRAIRQILAIDSTECKVHGSLFSTQDWKQFRGNRNTAGAKLHVVFDVNGQWIDDYIVTGIRRNDSRVGHLFDLAEKKMYVFDRGYSDLNFWLRIVSAGSHFVTRLKGQVIEVLPDDKSKALKSSTKEGVLYEGIYRPKYCTLNRANVPFKKHGKVKFRYVAYRDPLTKKVFHFVTSDFKSNGQKIADIYKKRWAVELLFRWLKGHLNIRYLETKSTNAARVQIAAAVLTQLLLQLKKITENYTGTLWDLLRTIRTTLIQKSLLNSEVPLGCRWKSRVEGNHTASYS